MTKDEAVALLDVGCHACAALPGEPCVGMAPGAFHPDRHGLRDEVEHEAEQAAQAGALAFLRDIAAGCSAFRVVRWWVPNFLGPVTFEREDGTAIEPNVVAYCGRKGLVDLVTGEPTRRLRRKRSPERDQILITPAGLELVAAQGPSLMVAPPAAPPEDKS